MPRALFSVYDKTGLTYIAKALSELGWELVASGGTARALSDAGLPVIQVEEVTKHPEMLDGRVKTLHPAIHGAILARESDADMQALNQHGYTPIALVVSNLYPFQETIAREGVTLAQAVEQIDIGGVALLRAAAKNFARVAVVCDPADYAPIVAELRAGGTIAPETRRRLAVKAFAATRDYDTAIQNYLASEVSTVSADTTPTEMPAALTVSLSKVADLRYGENPHQIAAFYATTGDKEILGGEVLGGKELSYNNILDLDAAWRALELFESSAVVIVKHLTPCGIATGASLAAAFPLALASDPVSAYGGVIAQSLDRGDPADANWRVVSKREPTPAEVETLRFAWKACQFVKSNAILLATYQDGIYASVGIGCGMPSRVDAARMAVEKAGTRVAGSVMASDAFFPFPDGAETGLQAGVTAIIAPGGSIRDDQIIAAADAAGAAMIFTGVRHFRH